MNRVAIFRDVYGAGARQSGARFRDEVLVCSACRKVYRRVAPGFDCFAGGSRGAPCTGRLFPPVAERGYRYLAGARIVYSPRDARCATCGAASGAPCVALGKLTSAGTTMRGVHRARRAK